MTADIKLALATTLVVLLASSPAMAGRAGGGGGGFHGSAGGAGSHSSGGGSFSGGTAYRGGEMGNRSGQNMNWNAAGHTGSFSSPHENISGSRPDMNWSNAGSRLGQVDRASHIANPNFAHNLGPGGHPGPGPHPAPGPHPGPNHHPDWYHGNWHDHWNHPWNNWPAGWWGAGFIAGAEWGALAAPWSWGYWSYANPYCTAPIVVDNTMIDYSQPFATAASPPVDSGAQADGQPPSAYAESPADQAMALLDAARESFAGGDYTTALTQCEKAIAKLPNDAVLHEFHGLVLFAMQRYKEATGAVYAVLSAGPGWDWTTLTSLYPDIDVYTQQLRDLEQYVNAHPNEPDVRFLLAYHYLTCGHTDAAADQLKAAIKLNPKDQLSAQLLSALTTTAPAEQAASSAPAKPIEASALVGNWKAVRPDAAAITLNLTKDGKYTWNYAQKGKPQQFSGSYTLADNLLILKQGENPVMVGQVTSLADNRFNFKLPGDNPNDPGLTFGK